MANSILAKMAVQISANTAEFNKALQKTSGDVSSFKKSVEGVGAAVVGAFAAQQIASFAFEVSKLAGEAEGVEKAFNKLDNANRLMLELKAATAGTVSELDLMKRTVQATNFGISLGALPKLLEFAAVRAQQTGQSVDYLVDSIVTGIGRKSPLILDNLGISAVALKEKLEGVSIAEASVGDVADAVGKIAAESLTQMGSLSENASTKIQRLSASWDDLKVAIGKAANETGVFATSLDFITDLINDFSGENRLKNAVESLGTALNAGEKNSVSFLHTIRQLEEELGKGNLAIAATDINAITEGMRNAGFVNAELVRRLRDLGVEIVGLNQNPIGPDVFKPVTELFDYLSGPKAEKAVKKLKEISAPTGGDASSIFFDPKALADSVETQFNRINGVILDVNGNVADLGVTFEDIEQEIPDSLQSLADKTVEITGLIVGGIVDIADAFGQAAVEGGKGFGDAILRSLAGFAQQFGALMIATGIAKISFDKFSGPGMIAAGAALVALGGAVRSTIANRPNLGSGSGGVAINRGNGFGPQNTVISGDFRIDGRDLVFVYDKNKSLDGRRK